MIKSIRRQRPDRPRPADARAQQVLAAAVRQAHDDNQSELPPVRSLCAEAHVCHVTMLAAQRRLESEGLLKMRHGRRARIPGAAREIAPQPQAHPWERTRVAIERDLFMGVWRLAPVLPAPKVLAAHYGVNHRTLRKALLALVASGAITAHGRSFRPLITPAGTSDRIVLVSRGVDSNLLLPMPPRGDRYLRALESECSRRGVRLATSLYYYGPRRLVCDVDWNNRQNRIARQGTILGFVIMSTSIDEVVPGLLRSLARFAVPVSLLSEAALAPRTDILPPGLPACIAWVVDSHAAGLTVGRHLLALGHRRVAYLSAQHDSDWSQRRLAGLRSAFEAAGLPGAVTAFTTDRHRASDAILSRVNLAMSRAVLPHLRRMVLEPSMHTLQPPVQQRLWQRVSQPLTTQLGWTMNEILGPVRNLVPLTQKALADRSITAWVAGNTITSLACHDLLVSSRVRVPQSISLVGFDDSADTATQGMTMFDFDAESAVSVCLNHVLGPSRPDASPRVAGIPGYLIERRTTGAG